MMSDETVFRFEDAAVTDQQIKKGNLTIMLDGVRLVEFESHRWFRFFCGEVALLVPFLVGSVIVGFIYGKATLLAMAITIPILLVIGFYALKVVRRGWASVNIKTDERWHTIGTGYRNQMVALKTAIDNAAAASRRRQALNG